MSSKSLRPITRDEAIEILGTEIYHLPNSALSDMLNTLADSGMSEGLSVFNNYEVEAD